jgi:hypothetical protein
LGVAVMLVDLALVVRQPVGHQWLRPGRCAGNSGIRSSYAFLGSEVSGRAGSVAPPLA